MDKTALREQLSLLNDGNTTTLPLVLLSLYTFLTKRGIGIQNWVPYMYYALSEFVNDNELDLKTMTHLYTVSNVIEDGVSAAARLDAFDELIIIIHDAIKEKFTSIVTYLEEERLFPTLSGETGLIFRTVVIEIVDRLCMEVKAGFIDCLPAVGLAVALPEGWDEAYRKHAASFLSSHPPNGKGPTLDQIIEDKKLTMANHGLLPPPPPEAEVKLEEAPVVVKQEPAVAAEIRKQNFEEATKRMNAAADAFHNENVNKGPVAAFWLAVRDFFNAKPAPVVAPAAQSRVQFEARPAAPLPAYKQVFLDRPAAPLPREAFVQLEEAPSRVDFDGKPAVSLEAAPAVAQSSAYDIARRRAEAHWAKHPRARKPDMAKLSKRIATDPHSYNPAKEDWPGIDTP